ncbi:Arylsulfatase A [Arenibacter nanhaiticus]|uniref:Arylsulfatase A n=1 Tax=Arenibacter nanhaiticus TaxID=558155 RepID=A0A1M6C573_9FLAO|nr:sulfatase [Arenibacter nanhaiticus]SHI55951.1 Arylsulfatase A [Arenibacter nanhaiticus]
MIITFQYISKSFWIILFCILPFENSIAQNTAKRPNIVWLVSEDNAKAYLSLYVKGGAQMPAIEALAKNGIVFNNAFSNAPVCSVARSTIISGCYAPRTGAQYHRGMKKVSMPDGIEMFPKYLKDAGYYTSNNAKEDYNYIEKNVVWDESSVNASYKNRKLGQPFFHVQNFGGTHEGQLHFSEIDISKLDNQNTNIPLFPYHPDTPIFRFTNAYYRDLHKKVDKKIGAFIKELEVDSLLDNTIIFYYADHGGVLPRSKGYVYESGLQVPMVVYIPEKWKAIFPMERGSRSDAFVEFIDLAPTVLNIAGLGVPEKMDGKPFLGNTLSTNDLEQRTTTFGYADRFDEKYDLVRSFRQDNYKYIRNYQPFNIDGLFNFYRYRMLAYQEWQMLFKTDKLNKIQQQFFLPRSPESLYDLKTDPNEVHNLAEDPAYRSVLLDLRSKLQQKVKEMPDLGFYPEAYFLENGLENPWQFGQENKKDIEKLIEIADLSLETFVKVKDDIKLALESKNPWKRYWALIDCSTFGNEASFFYTKAEEMAQNDPENLVRIRAIEFLTLNDRPISSELILELLKRANSESEAILMLNTVALLKTVKSGFNIVLPRTIFNPQWLAKKGSLVNERIKFINKKK